MADLIRTDGFISENLSDVDIAQRDNYLLDSRPVHLPVDDSSLIRNVDLRKPNLDPDNNTSSGASGGSDTVTPKPIDGQEDIGNGHYTINPDMALSSIWTELFGLLVNGSSQYSAFDTINGMSYLDILSNVIGRVNDIFDELDLDSDYAGAQLEFLEKVANVAHSYLDNMFQQLLNYQSWYLQQEYNSPLNQLKRLEDAGLSSAFFFGNVSNSAPSQAGSGSFAANPATASLSNAGQAVEAEKASKRQTMASLFGTMADTTAQLVKAGIDSQKTLAEAENIKRLTPLQLANAVQDFHNKGVYRDYMQKQANVIESTDFRNWFQTATQQARENVQSNLDYYKHMTSDDVAKQYDSIWVDEQVYTGKVKEKDGSTHFQDFTRNELENAFNAGGITSTGGKIVGSDTWQQGGKLKLGAKNETVLPLLPGLNKTSLAAEGEFNIGHSRDKIVEDFHKDQTSYSNDKRTLNDVGKYVDKGNGFKIGDTTFTLNTTRKRVDKEQYKRDMMEARDLLLNSQRRYNMMSDEAVAQWLYSLDRYNKNYSSGILRMLKDKASESIFAPLVPKNMIGD